MKDSTQVAEFFGITLGALRVRQHRGQCPPHSKKVGKRLFWDEKTIIDWILKQEEEEKQ